MGILWVGYLRERDRRAGSGVADAAEFGMLHGICLFGLAALGFLLAEESFMLLQESLVNIFVVILGSVRVFVP
jgi:hypothetical protein